MDKPIAHQSYCVECGKPLQEIDYVQNALSVFAEHRDVLCSDCNLRKQHRELVQH